MRVKYFAWSARKEHDDYYTIRDDNSTGYLFVVVDANQGITPPTPVGLVIGNAICARYFNSSAPNRLVALEDAFRETNSHLLQNMPGVKAACAAVAVSQYQLWSINAGDTRIYIQHDARYLSISGPSPFLGELPTARFETWTQSIDEPLALAICSDGAYGGTHLCEIQDILWVSQTPMEAAKRLERLMEAYKATDDATAIMVMIQWGEANWLWRSGQQAISARAFPIRDKMA